MKAGNLTYFAHPYNKTSTLKQEYEPEKVNLSYLSRAGHIENKSRINVHSQVTSALH